LKIIKIYFNIKILMIITKAKKGIKKEYIPKKEKG